MRIMPSSLPLMIFSSTICWTIKGWAMENGVIRIASTIEVLKRALKGLAVANTLFKIFQSVPFFISVLIQVKESNVLFLKRLRAGILVLDILISLKYNFATKSPRNSETQILKFDSGVYLNKCIELCFIKNCVFNIHH